MNNTTLVFGCSGTVGLEFIHLIKENNILFYSRKKPTKLSKKLWRYIDLNKKIKKIPIKVNKIFFFASPYYKLNNLKKNNHEKELIWIKKIQKKIKTNFFIYLSSSSVYLENHPVGNVKKKCEEYLVNNPNYNYLQIWRPYNLIGNENSNLSDHFHNILIKKFCLEGKVSHQFYGSPNDERGYSSVKKFCKLIINKSNLTKNFLYDYGNSNTLKIKDISKIFKEIFDNKYKKKIKYSFRSKIANINTLRRNKKTKYIDTKENSSGILKKYYLLKI